MDWKKRPISVTLLAFLYIAVGTVGFVFHSREILMRHAFQSSDALVELVELIAIVCGAFMLQGRNWARWLAVAWMAFHVVLSFFGAARELIVHSLLFVLIVGLLFQAKAARYFRPSAEPG